MTAEEQWSGGAEEQRGKDLLRTLVLGLGNPILRDDGVGWRVVHEVRCTSEVQRTSNGIEFDCVALGGLALMERLVGYDRVVLVDALQTRGGTPGAVYRLALDDLPTMHADAAHDATLQAALELGRRLGAHLPAAEDIAIIAIEAADVLDFGERLSPAVEAAVPEAATAVLKAISGMGRGFTTKERRHEEKIE